MTTQKLYVCDTVSIISYFNEIFGVGQILSKQAYGIIDDTFKNNYSLNRLSIPAMVFIEIFEKWLTYETIVNQFHSEVFVPVSESETIEIREIDKEVISVAMDLNYNLSDHDAHDKLIVSSAIILNAPIITTDTEIINFADLSGQISVIM